MVPSINGEDRMQITDSVISYSVCSDIYGEDVADYIAESVQERFGDTGFGKFLDGELDIAVYLESAPL